ncbi:MAG TPA: hypothetical protein VFW33_13775 [Gemmataceae bacterium]|nr:hypothetical protein [Gemmataceae bacterium]
MPTVSPFRAPCRAGRYGGARAKCLRTDRLRRLLPDLRLTPLTEGLPRTIDNFVNHLD